MNKIIITTDSTADIPASLAKKRDIRVSPLHVILGDKEYTDGVDVTLKDLFDYYKQTGNLPKTSACSQEEYRCFFEKNLSDGDKLIHFSISSECSCSHFNAKTAAEEFGGRVKVIDSRYLSSGQGLIVLKACDYRDAGRTFDEIAEASVALTDRVQTSTLVDSAEFLHKGGRCTAAAALISKILKIHPSVYMKDGKLSLMKKYAGSLTRCIGSYVEDVAEKVPCYDDKRAFITHSGCSEEIVSAVVKKVKELFKFKEIIVTEAGATVAVHAGPNAIGFLYIEGETKVEKEAQPVNDKKDRHSIFKKIMAKNV